ncbi:hypothetical protein HDU98_008040, partial [Podochytrium sp. JEL0797]
MQYCTEVHQPIAHAHSTGTESCTCLEVTTQCLTTFPAWKDEMNKIGELMDSGVPMLDNKKRFRAYKISAK